MTETEYQETTTPDTFAKIETAVFTTAETLITNLLALLTRLWHIIFPPQKEEGIAQPDPDSLPATNRQKRIFYAIGLLAITIDQISKWAIEATVPLNTQSIPFPSLYPYFQITHIPNTGAAFGIFPNVHLFFTTLSILLSFGIAYFNFQLPNRSRKIRITLGVVFGGAMGNLIDRFRLGHVTDFMDVNLRSIIDVPLADWAIFNVADACIVFGTLTLAYFMFKEQEVAHQKEQQEKLETAVSHIITQMQTDGTMQLRPAPPNKETLPPFLAARQPKSDPIPESTL